jgi:hypothetical protein
MTEQEVFDLLDGGRIFKYDHRIWNPVKSCFGIDISDRHGDLASSQGTTLDIAWKNAVAEMLESLEERKEENSEANEPTMSAGERN